MTDLEPDKARPHEFTPDQIVAGIASAIREREFAVIPSLIKLLAIQDPSRAQEVLDTFEIAELIRGGSS